MKNKASLIFLIKALGCIFISAVLFIACDKTKSGQPALSDTISSNSAPERLLDSDPKAMQKQSRLDSLFRKLHTEEGFNGVVLVAQHRKVIYSNAFGYADFKTKDTLTSKKIFQLASVTKPFTALAILILKERGKLSLEDTVKNILPDFLYPLITIRHLLTHSSGLADYLSLAHRFWPNKKQALSNYELLRQFSLHKPSLLFSPGSRFTYSNTGYCILALLVEKISGMSYSKFLRTNIFQPLGMSNTGLLADINTTKLIAKGHGNSGQAISEDYLDQIYGDKGLYSSVEDLFLWDQALYSERLLKHSTLEEAFQASFQLNHAEAYGFGWRVRELACGENVLYHTGRWHGFRSYLMRNRKDTSTVIILSNVDKGISIEDFQFILYP